jgi:ribosome recycling factor
MNEQIDEILEELKLEMEDSVESLKRNFKTVRTGKVNTAILDNVFIDYYGSMTKLGQVATVVLKFADSMQFLVKMTLTL